MERLKLVKILEPQHPNKSTNLFGGKSSGILNWNDLKYPHFYKLREQIRALFWTASEVDMGQDVKQFPNLSEKERDAFLKIIGLLATLDAPQTNMAMKIAQYSTDPSVISIMSTISDQEGEHNHSYSYVLSSLTDLNVQMKAFELGRTDEILLKRNEKMTEIYNEFALNPTIDNLLKAMVYTSILEGLFFYSGFAFFYNLAKNQKMVGTSTMISYINRDELQHGKFVSELFRATLAEHPQYNTEEFIEWVYEQFKLSVEQEVSWSKYVLKGIDGIDLIEMEGYIEYRANKVLRLLGLSEIFDNSIENPMKWIRAYVDSFDDTKSDFFEQKPRQYTKVNDSNGFGDLNGFDDL
jgi:ribonucleoside-diphosphate reductase beta chain